MEFFEPAILLITLICGLVISRFGISPIIGYLIAGFILYALGFNQEKLPLLNDIADIGVYLLLFVIGLKLDIKNIIQPHVWVTASIHMLLITLVLISLLKSIFILGFLHLDDIAGAQDLIILAFALSFSSTVLIMKMLESKGEIESRYGQITIGILIIQDLFAVAFLTVSKSELPSIYSLFLLLLPLLRPLLYKICDHLGHGDLLVLFGLAMTLIFGATLFNSLGLKADLGALVMGILLAKHKKAPELVSSLFYFKELFLISFFLSIGLKGVPLMSDLILSLMLVLFLPIKGILFFILLTSFKQKIRTAFLTSLALMNYSEFGLIVTAVASNNELLPPHLLITLALTLSLSFFFASIINRHYETIFQKLQPMMLWFERTDVMIADETIRVGRPKFLIVGVGHLGIQTYHELNDVFPEEIAGIDHNSNLVSLHQEEKLNVALGDATDSQIWNKLPIHDCVEYIILCMPHQAGNLLALEQIRMTEYKGKILSISYYLDDMQKLKENGVDHSLSVYSAAGTGLAQEIIRKVKKNT